MSSPPPPVEHIGADQLLAALPTLRTLGFDAEATDLEREALAFCGALLALRRSPAGRGHLRDFTSLPTDPLARSLHSAADSLILADDPGGLGSWCAALSARLLALSELTDPHISRQLVLIGEHQGSGHLALYPFDPEDLPDLGCSEDP